jgi:hypothetical protein
VGGVGRGGRLVGLGEMVLGVWVGLGGDFGMGVVVGGGWGVGGWASGAGLLEYVLHWCSGLVWKFFFIINRTNFLRENVFS